MIIKFQNSLALLLISSLFLACSEKPKETQVVPSDWYQLPEAGESDSGGSLALMGASVDRMFDAQERSLDGLSADSVGSRDGKRKPANWVPWHLAGVSTDLAISADGLLGALLFSGSASVMTNWFRKSDQREQLKPLSLLKDEAKVQRLALTANESQEKVKRDLEPLIQTAVHTGRVRNEGAFRNHLYRSAESFRKMAQSLSAIHVSSGRFAPSAFILEISFDAEGNLLPFASAGAGVQFRFDWIVGEKSKLGQLTLPENSALFNFIQAITPDLEAAAEASEGMLADTGFKLSMVKIGLGMSSEFEIGVASAGMEVMGAVIFGDNEDGDECNDPDGDGDCHGASVYADEFTLVKAKPSAETLHYALEQGIPFQEVKADQVAFKVKHRKFQNGLRKAVKMASFFAAHASRKNGGEWRVREIETEYSLSVSGTLGLTTLQGTGELELEFENTRFNQ